MITDKSNLKEEWKRMLSEKNIFQMADASIRKKKYERFKYSLTDLKLAIEAVQGPRQLSINKACQEYNIPKGTLVNRLHGHGSVEERRMGPLPVLSTEEENKLEKWILDKAHFGFPMHENEIKDVVQKVIVEDKRPNPFTDNRPGKKWLELFLKRKPAISKRNAEIILKARVSVTESEIREWFEGVRLFLEQEGCLDILQDADRIYNADETGVQLCPKTGKVLGPKQYRNFYDVAVGKEKECITILANFSASGKAVPPMIVLPFKRIPEDIANLLPDDNFVGRSDSGFRFNIL
ncbi:hypothetical protein NQ318_023442 [Aromia moschata]|uniref:HTH CENPB-type domain-containing protein n=1 Tax=Aromia moschata TaxID=1265417 RepID=A0AAV8YJT2_9CUCU|nr:hypothetical protein NQ318_023442 [Aromia moschata]